jgi:hypothetical protein
VDGTLNRYREKCLEMLDKLDGYNITHIPRKANTRANTLAQHASGYEVK